MFENYITDTQMFIACIRFHIICFRHPCTSLKMWEGFILCAFGSGHIRVFGIKTLSLICEVAAHARWITATDIAPETGYFLSVSEDSFAKVWQISKQDGRVRCCVIFCFLCFCRVT
jgi:WD40 repeat protein